MKQGTCRRFLWGGRRVLSARTVMLVTMFLTSPTAAGHQDVVRIAGSAWIGDAPTWVADREGLFNLDRPDDAPVIEVEMHGSGLEALGQLLGGEADFALAATTPTALGLMGVLDDHGPGSASLVVLGSVALSNQSHYLVAPARHGIRSARDLSGRRVGVMFGTSSHYGWSRFSAFHELDHADVELVDTPVTGMAEGLRQGQLEAAVIWQPWDLALRESLDEPITVLPMRMIYTVNWLLLSSREFVAERPDVVERVLRGYLGAMDMIDAQPNRTLAHHAAATGRDESELASQAEAMLWRLSLNWSVLVNLGTQFEWLASWPEHEGLAVPEPSRYLHATSLRNVAPELVTLPDYLLTVQQQDVHP